MYLTLAELRYGPSSPSKKQVSGRSGSHSAVNKSTTTETNGGDFGESQEPTWSGSVTSQPPHTRQHVHVLFHIPGEEKGYKESAYSMDQWGGSPPPQLKRHISWRNAAAFWEWSTRQRTANRG
jgi:hypothetical protein